MRKLLHKLYRKLFLEKHLFFREDIIVRKDNETIKAEVKATYYSTDLEPVYFVQEYGSTKQYTITGNQKEYAGGWKLYRGIAPGTVNLSATRDIKI